MLSHMKQSEERLASKLESRLKALEEKFDRRFIEMETKMLKLSEENASLRTQNDRLANRMDVLDRDRRRNNVVFTGLKVSSPLEAVEAVKRVVKLANGPVLEIGNVRLIRTKVGPKVLGTCANFESKMILFRNKKALRGPEGRPVYVDDDLTPTDAEIQYRARQAAKELRLNGKDVQIGPLKIRVDGTWWPYDPATKTFAPKINF